MESAIKSEIDQISPQSLCHGCLSKDRKLKPLTGVNNKVFYSLLIASGMLFGSEERMICWECEAVLRRVMKFQVQICQAQNKLMEIFCNMDPNVKTLSNLSTITKDHYDLYYEYITIDQPTQPDSNLKPNENISEITPETTSPLTEPLLNNCTVKLEKLEPKPETDHFSDSDLNNEEDTNDDIKMEITNTKSNNESKNSLRCKNGRLKRKKKNYLFHRTYASIKNEEINFDDIKSYFVKEFLDFEQVENVVPKPRLHLSGFKCDECKIQYRAISNYLMHQNLAHIKPDSSTTCLLCKKKLPDLDNLRTHWKFAHCAYWRCTLCNSYRRRTGLKNHFKNKHAKVYCCTKCREEFRCKEQFNSHYKKEHDLYICDQCNKMYKSKAMLIRHLLVHSEKHLCKICNKEYVNRDRLVRHISDYHPETTKRKVNKEAAYCVECDKQYYSEALFKKHLSYSPKHNGKPQKSASCPECGKIFTRKTYMKNHLYQTHMKEKAKWKCTMCDKIYVSNWGLKLHVKDVHLKVPKVRDKICDLCGRGFFDNQLLKKHRRTHTGERPYQCGYCSSAFGQRSAMVSHQRTQHRDML